MIESTVGCESPPGDGAVGQAADRLTDIRATIAVASLSLDPPVRFRCDGCGRGVDALRVGRMGLV
jgi:hypothetical protein